MLCELTQTGKESVKIAAFSGYNHTDFTALGEWYDMCNLSDVYAPLLSPRSKRETLMRLEADARYLLAKNGLLYYSAPDGIYCAAPQGNNPFSENENPVKIHESENLYSFLEMGNKVFCFDRTAHTHHLSIENARVCNIGNSQNTLRSFAHFSGENDVREVASYFNNHRVMYNSMSGYVLKDLTQSGNKWIDTAAEELLNISFTYATEENGSLYILGDKRTKHNPLSASFAANRYYLGTDNKFYYYDKTSDSSSEITAPYIAVFLHKGLQNPDTDYPQLEEGDVFNFTLGYSMNYNHVSQKDTHIYPTKEPNLVTGVLLRANKIIRCNENTGSAWFNEGWEYCVVVDYNAALIAALTAGDLIQNSTSFSELTDYTIANPKADAGRQQVYPRFVQFENPTFSLAAPLEHNNRIWCANNENNEIKASALGNFRNWDDYRGLSSDSFAVSVGSDGDFTASCVLDESLFFFKEHSYTVVYGNRPANFCTNTVTDFIGMDENGAASLQVIGSNACFMGIDGRIYCFNGQTAQCISAPLGREQLQVLSSAHSAEKYYLLVQREAEKRLFVFNLTSGMWFVEDAEGIDSILPLGGRVCALQKSNTVSFDENEQPVCGEQTQVVMLEPWHIGETQEHRVQWFCESGVFGLDDDNYHRFCKLSLTFQSEAGAEVEVLARYDDDAHDTPLAKFVCAEKGTHSEHIPLRRAACFRLKLRGTGFSKIYSLRLVREKGSEK